MYPDPRVLSTDEVELVAMEINADDPAMVVDVRVQRIHCVRDKHGNVTEVRGGRLMMARCVRGGAVAERVMCTCRGSSCHR